MLPCRSILTKFLLFFLIIPLQQCTKEEPIEETPEIIIDLAEVNTIDYFDLAQTHVRVESRISNDGNGNISKAGVCWSTNLDPTVEDQQLLTQTKIGGYVLKLENLLPNTVYYIRAFAENQSGIAYGNQLMFTTKEIPVFDGDMSISSKAELDLFSSGEFIRVNGDLIIGSQTYYFSGANNDIETLSGLETIESIHGDLIIRSNADLISLNGLNKLKAVHGNVTIYGNGLISDLNKLESLDSIYGSLTIERNNEVNMITAFANLTYIEGDININQNDKLIRINGFEDLESFEGSVEIISNNNLEEVTSFSAFEQLKDIDISYNYNLVTLNFESLKKTNGYINIHSSKLTQLQFDALNTINGYFNLNYNSELISLESLSNLTQVKGTFSIDYNNALYSLEDLLNLTNITGDLDIYNNDALTSLDGLENLATVGGDVIIRYNYKLSDYCALGEGVINSISDSSWWSPIYGNSYNPTKDDLINGDCD